MPSIPQRSFASGEISPSLFGRVDTNKYVTALKKCRNCVISRTTGAWSRSGTQYIVESRDHRYKSKLIPFYVGEAATYILDFSHNTLRIIKEGAYLLSRKINDISAISKSNPCIVTTSSAHGILKDGEEIVFKNLKGMKELNNKHFIVDVHTPTTFGLKYKDGRDVDSANFETYVSGGEIEIVLNINTRFSEIESQELKYSQSGDTMVLTHHNFPPFQLRRHSETEWTLGEIRVASSVPPPGRPSVSPSEGGRTVPHYLYRVRVSAVLDTGEETFAGQATSAGYTVAPTAQAPFTITITPIPGVNVLYYKVFKLESGFYKLLDTTRGTPVTDIGQDLDNTQQPLEFANIFGTKYHNFEYTFTVTKVDQDGSGNLRITWSSNNNIFINDDEVVITGIIGVDGINNRIFKLSSVTSVIGGFTAILKDPNTDAILKKRDFPGGTETVTYTNKYHGIIADRGGNYYGDDNFNWETEPPYNIRALFDKDALGTSPPSIIYARITTSEGGGDDIELARSAGRDTSTKYGYVHNPGSAGLDLDDTGAAFTVNCYSDTNYSVPVNITDDITVRTQDGSMNIAFEFPSACSFYQQRLVYANSVNRPESVWLSQIGRYNNFSKHDPIIASDSFSFDTAGNTVNPIKHLIDIGRLVAFTGTGEWIINGDDAGGLTPHSVNMQQVSYNGASNVRPVVIDNSVIYVQAQGSIVRDFSYSAEARNYAGRDLTIYNSHLVDGYHIVDMAFVKVPNPIIFAVRNDGVLLSLTYERGEEILGWARHDFEGGKVENVAVVPENLTDTLYLTIKRTINGEERRYIERLSPLDFFDVRDFKAMDSHLTYDGRNKTDITIFTQTDLDWTDQDTIFLRASRDVFTSDDVNREIHFGKTKFSIIGYTSPRVLTARPHKTVPENLRRKPTKEWSRAVDTVSGLDHLEGKDISVLADRFVAGSPFDKDQVKVTVVDGSIKLDSFYSVIHAGLPFIADIATLAIDTAEEGNTIMGTRKLVKSVFLFLQKSRGIWTGEKEPEEGDDALEGLFPLKIRENEPYDDPINLKSGYDFVNITSSYSESGSVFIRQVDPLPLRLLSVTPVFKLGSGTSRRK